LFIIISRLRFDFFSVDDHSEELFDGAGGGLQENQLPAAVAFFRFVFPAVATTLLLAQM